MLGRPCATTIPALRKALLDEAGEAELVEDYQKAAAAFVGGGMWSGPKVARWIAHRNGLQSVHVQRGFEYLRKVSYSPQVPRPSNAAWGFELPRERLSKKTPRG